MGRGEPYIIRHVGLQVGFAEVIVYIAQEGIPPGRFVLSGLALFLNEELVEKEDHEFVNESPAAVCAAGVEEFLEVATEAGLQLMRDCSLPKELVAYAGFPSASQAEIVESASPIFIGNVYIVKQEIATIDAVKGVFADVVELTRVDIEGFAIDFVGDAAFAQVEEVEKAVVGVQRMAPFALALVAVNLVTAVSPVLEIVFDGGGRHCG